MRQKFRRISDFCSNSEAEGYPTSTSTMTAFHQYNLYLLYNIHLSQRGSVRVCLVIRDILTNSSAAVTNARILST